MFYNYTIEFCCVLSNYRILFVKKSRHMAMFFIAIIHRNQSYLMISPIIHSVIINKISFGSIVNHDYLKILLYEKDANA